MKGQGETKLELIEDKTFPGGLYSVGMKVTGLEEMVEKMRADGVEIRT